MLFRRLAILSALSELVTFVLSVSSATVSSTLALADVDVDAFFAFNLAAEVLFARLVVLALLIAPLPVRLGSDRRHPTGFSSSPVANDGTDECRRALRATSARSVRVPLESGEDSLNSNMATSSLSAGSVFTVDSLFIADPLPSPGSLAGSSGTIVFADDFRCAVLV